jgi:hypothetical protein
MLITTQNEALRALPLRPWQLRCTYRENPRKIPVRKKIARLVVLVDFFLSGPFNITLLQKDSAFGLQLGLPYVMRLKNKFKLFLL